ncbi:hypothetical protein WUBG_05796, partial [Wuchereria bancrofti]
MSTDEFRANKPGHSILADGIEVGCHYYANWDIRLVDIVKTRCIQLIRSNIEQTKCKELPYYCKYNSEYQYLFNDLLLIDKPPSRSCLLHYIDNATLSDMDSRLPKNDFVLFQQPGSAFYAIDFSYALLEDGKCHYVEVEVNFNYTNSRSCPEAVMFKTNYMPLKIFACRCRTEVSSKTPCDKKLAAKIPHLARNW